MSNETRAVEPRLRIEWGLAVLIALGVAVAGNYFVGVAAGEDTGRRWVLVAGVVLAYELWFLHRHLPRNDDGDEPLRGSLGLANAVTLIRGMLYAAVSGFLFVPPVEEVRWVPGLCYGVGTVLDFLDGWVARRTGRQSALGAELDVAFDTLGFLIAPLIAVVWGRFPVWYLAISAARYLFRGGEAYRRYRGRYVAPLPPSRIRRPLAALQMVVITAALVPVLPSTMMVPIATVAMVPSLLIFVRDWLVVSRQMVPGHSGGTSEPRASGREHTGKNG